MKNKFGSGYILEVKLKAGIAHETQDSVEQRMNTLEEYVFSMFPDAVIVERFGLRAQYKIPRNNVKSLALVFSSLEEGKTRNVYVLFFWGGGGGGIWFDSNNSLQTLCFFILYMPNTIWCDTYGLSVKNSMFGQNYLPRYLPCVVSN